MHAAAEAARRGRRARGRSARGARRARGCTKCSSRRALVVVERLDLDRAAGASARRQEAVAVGHAPDRTSCTSGAWAASRAADVERDDAAAVQEQQPANRPAERQLALAVVEPRVPVHVLRERQAAQQAAHHVRQRVDGCPAALALAEREVLALRRLDRFERPQPPRRSSSRIPPRPASAAHPVRRRVDAGGPVSASSRSV